MKTSTALILFAVMAILGGGGVLAVDNVLKRPVNSIDGCGSDDTPGASDQCARIAAAIAEGMAKGERAASSMPPIRRPDLGPIDGGLLSRILLGLGLASLALAGLAALWRRPKG